MTKGKKLCFYPMHKTALTTSIKTINNMEHFFERECSHCIANFIHCFFSSQTIKTFIAFLLCYTALKYTNMKGV